MLTKKTPKSVFLFSCEKCDFECFKKSEWDRHLITRKHFLLTDLTPKNPLHFCKNCDKQYISREGLWYHLKKCDKNKSVGGEVNSDIKELTLLVSSLVDSNKKLQTQLSEISKNPTTNNISQTNTFNLNFFLNDNCKDAMNIDEFVNTIDIKIHELEQVGTSGYIDGISNIILDRLNWIDVYKRPLHCSDAKRETIYIKDENVWKKEETNNPILRQAIKNVSFQNMKLISNWGEINNESKTIDSKLNDTFLMLVKESSGGNGDLDNNENKIIHKISKRVIIDKVR